MVYKSQAQRLDSLNMKVLVGRQFTFIVLFVIGEGYQFTCPSAGHWNLRAKSICPKANLYTCLFDVSNGQYVDTCDGPRIEIMGQKTTINNNYLNTEDCSIERYQPFDFTTVGATSCIYQKSRCVEEGQYTILNETSRSTVTDTTCGCDTDKGFNSVTNIKACSCIPSVEDCSCFKDLDAGDLDLYHGLCESHVLSVRRNEEQDEKKEPLIQAGSNIEHQGFSNKKAAAAVVIITALIIAVCVTLLILSITKVNDRLISVIGVNSYNVEKEFSKTDYGIIQSSGVWRNMGQGSGTVSLSKIDDKITGVSNLHDRESIPCNVYSDDVTKFSSNATPCIKDTHDFKRNKKDHGYVTGEESKNSYTEKNEIKGKRNDNALTIPIQIEVKEGDNEIIITNPISQSQEKEISCKKLITTDDMTTISIEPQEHQTITHGDNPEEQAKKEGENEEDGKKIDKLQDKASESHGEFKNFGDTETQKLTSDIVHLSKSEKQPSSGIPHKFDGESDKQEHLVYDGGKEESVPGTEGSDFTRAAFHFFDSVKAKTVSAMNEIKGYVISNTNDGTVGKVVETNGMDKTKNISKNKNDQLLCSSDVDHKTNNVSTDIDLSLTGTSNIHFVSRRFSENMDNASAEISVQQSDKITIDDSSNKIENNQNGIDQVKKVERLKENYSSSIDGCSPDTEVIDVLKTDNVIPQKENDNIGSNSDVTTTRLFTPETESTVENINLASKCVDINKDIEQSSKGQEENTPDETIKNTSHSADWTMLPTKQVHDLDTLTSQEEVDPGTENLDDVD